MRSAGRTVRKLVGNSAVAFQTELPNLRAPEHFRIARAVRHVTRRTAFEFERSVLENKRTLFVRVTFDTSRVDSDREFGLFLLEASVRVMTIAAFHCPFEHFVMKGLGKLRFCFAVAADTKLLLVCTEHRDRRILPRCSADERNRINFRQFVLRAVRRMAFRAADVVAPVIAAPEIAVFLFSGVTAETGFGNFLRVFVFERNYLGLVAVAFDVRLARSVTRFAADDFAFPGGKIFEHAVFCAGDVP